MRLLLIDDDSLALEALKSTLEITGGHDCSCLINPDEATRTEVVSKEELGSTQKKGLAVCRDGKVKARSTLKRKMEGAGTEKRHEGVKRIKTNLGKEETKGVVIGKIVREGEGKRKWVEEEMIPSSISKRRMLEKAETFPSPLAGHSTSLTPLSGTRGMGEGGLPAKSSDQSTGASRRAPFSGMGGAGLGTPVERSLGRAKDSQAMGQPNPCVEYRRKGEGVTPSPEFCPETKGENPGVSDMGMPPNPKTHTECEMERRGLPKHTKLN